MQTIRLRVAENGGSVPMTPEQVRIIEAVSPTADVERVAGGLRITVHDLHGAHSAELGDGDDYVLTAEDKSEIADMAAELVSVPVQDVQIDGTSILNNGVANVPVANDSTYGAIKVGAGLFVQAPGTSAEGQLSIYKAGELEIKAGVQGYKPIVPQRQHLSTFYGLAKAAGDSTQSASSNAVGTYTDAAKVAIQKMLGVYEAPFSLIYENTITEETGKISIISDIGSNPFSLKEILVLFDGVVGTGSSTGGVILNSGSIGTNVAYLAISTLYSSTAQTRSAHIQIIGGRMFGDAVNSNMSTVYGPVAVSTSKNASGWIECGLINEITILSLNDHKFSAGTIRIYGR